MENTNYAAVIVAVIATFVASTIYYIILAKQRAKYVSAAAASTAAKPQPAKMVLELGRNLIVTLVVSYLVHHLHTDTLVKALGLAAMLWLAFPFVLLSGSVMWDKAPAKLAIIHAGDAVLHLVLITSILSIWY